VHDRFTDRISTTAGCRQIRGRLPRLPLPRARVGVAFLAQDLPATDNRVLAAAQQPIRVGALMDRVALAAWRGKPCWYVVTSEDRMISPSLQRQLAATMNAHVSTMRAGHTPFFKAEGDGRRDPHCCRFCATKRWIAVVLDRGYAADVTTKGGTVRAEPSKIVRLSTRDIAYWSSISSSSLAPVAVSAENLIDYDRR